MSVRIDSYLHGKLLESAEGMRDKVRLGSLGLPHAGDWINVIPSPSLGLQLRSSEFRTAALYRLGLPVFQTAGPCIACGKPSDVLADHAVSCASQGERILRHNHLRDALYHMAVSASLGPTREDRALLPGVDQRPADILLPLWAGGQDCALDITVVSPFQQQALEKASVEPGYALTMRYDQKWRKYGELCRAEGIVFEPLPIETLGGWGDSAVRVLKKLGQALARASCQDEAEVTRHMFGRLSILLQKSNASLILNRTPLHPDPQVNGVL